MRFATLLLLVGCRGSFVIPSDCPTTVYGDVDGDGYGDAAAARVACVDVGLATVAGDCDDGDPTVFPGAIETCDGVDHDCDGLVDDPTAPPTWYIDYDGDGHGADRYTATGCDAPAGYVAIDDDCDDTSAGVYPGAAEVCDGDDNDCNGVVDDITGGPTWYADADRDGYGDAARALAACEAPAGYVADDTDCDDTTATTHPDAHELYDGIDNDCDGDVDDQTWIGTGADGALVVSGRVDLSTRGGDFWAVEAISTASVDLDATPDLSVGDEVLLIGMRGSSSRHANVGVHEFATVAAVSSTTVTFTASIAGTYGERTNRDLSGQSVQLVRVPQYTDVTVKRGATLTTAGWDGSTGGVLAFRATGVVTVAEGGAISVDGLGYRGGATGVGYDCDAYQGESYAGTGAGGSCSGSYNESSGAYAANKGGGGANVTGGGGNHAGSATAGDAWYPGVYTAPAAGSTYGAPALPTWFFGSGGGGVWHGSGGAAGAGGSGGGVLILAANAISLAGADAITADGASTSAWAQGTWTYGAGGGAGGTVALKAADLDLAASSVHADGGAGEASHERRGGDGGDGRIRIDYFRVEGADYGTGPDDAALTRAVSPAPYTSTPSGL